MKTWNEIKNETLNLGFEKSKAYDKNKPAFIEAYNWAQRLMASTIGGIHKVMSVATLNGQRVMYDLVDMARNYDDEYITLSATGITDTNYQRIDGYIVTDNRFLLLPEDYNGVALVHYLGMPMPITVDTADDEECQLPPQWANIMPYLMANRLFLDDDAAKASYYWNLYTDMRDEILRRENKPQITIMGGYDIDGWCE